MADPIDITTYKHRPPTGGMYRSDNPVPPERLDGARLLAALTIEQLAELTGIGAADIQMFESGMLAPTPEQVKAIATATGFPVSWFYQPWEPAFNWENSSLRFH